MYYNDNPAVCQPRRQHTSQPADLRRRLSAGGSSVLTFRAHPMAATGSGLCRLARYMYGTRCENYFAKKLVYGLGNRGRVVAEADCKFVC